MNFEHLRLFVRIAAVNNISLAGKELSLSAAVASAHINKLEESLGTKLLYRTTRKVSLTQEGKTFLPYAEEVLASVEAAKAAVGLGSITPQGTLRITAPASFGRMHIIPALKRFMSCYPDLKIDLRLSDSIVDMVEGGFDIAVRNAALHDSSLIARRLATDKRILCASPEYLNEHGTPTSPEDINHHHCINLTDIDSWTFSTPEGHQKIKCQSTFKADNGESVRDACTNGMGLTVSSEWCAYKELRTGKLVEVLKDYPIISDTAIWAVFPSTRLIAPKVRAFIDFFTKLYGDTPYWTQSTSPKI